MTTKPSNGRIPLELQAVFLASNRGEEVHTPPPGNVAFRMFQSIFHRSSNKPQQKQGAVVSKTTTGRGFFGLQKNRLRRSSTMEINGNGKPTALPRRASQTNMTSFAERTCPVRDVSFETVSPTRSRQTTSTYNTGIIIESSPDDISVASSVTFTVVRDVKKKSTKPKKVRMQLCIRTFHHFLAITKILYVFPLHVRCRKHRKLI